MEDVWNVSIKEKGRTSVVPTLADNQAPSFTFFLFNDNSDLCAMRSPLRMDIQMTRREQSSLVSWTAL